MYTSHNGMMVFLPQVAMMGVSFSLLWKFMITKEMNGVSADLFLGADQGMPQPPLSIPASSTQTPDNTGPAVT